MFENFTKRKFHIYSVWPQSVPLVPKNTFEKCDTLGTFTQKVLFLDYNKTKKWTLWGGTPWGHALYIIFWSFYMIHNIPVDRNFLLWKSTLFEILYEIWNLTPNMYHFSSACEIWPQLIIKMIAIHIDQNNY